MSEPTSNPFGANIEMDDDLRAVGLDKVIAKAEPGFVREAPERERAAPVITERRVRIVLDDNDNIGPTGQFFGINGVGYMLKPNMEADVPLGIIDVLNNAVMEVPIVDPTTKQVLGFKKRLRFPYRVVTVIEPTRQAA